MGGRLACLCRVNLNCPLMLVSIAVPAQHKLHRQYTSRLFIHTREHSCSAHAAQKTHMYTVLTAFRDWGRAETQLGSHANTELSRHAKTQSSRCAKTEAWLLNTQERWRMLTCC